MLFNSRTFESSHQFEYAGIIVLRLLDQSRSSIRRALEPVLPLFSAEPCSGIFMDHRGRSCAHSRRGRLSIDVHLDSAF